MDREEFRVYDRLRSHGINQYAEYRYRQGLADGQKQGYDAGWIAGYEEGFSAQPNSALANPERIGNGTMIYREEAK